MVVAGVGRTGQHWGKPLQTSRFTGYENLGLQVRVLPPLSDESPGYRGFRTVLKTIGDALMLRIPDPGDGIVLGLRIANDLMLDHGAPAVRVGLHHGQAVENEGVYFGAAVNLAARVSALATGGEVLVSGSTAALAPDLDGVFYESRGRQTLKNVAEPVEVFAALRLGGPSGDALPIDPVCRMAVDPDRAAGRLVHDGGAYFFCSLSCAGVFAQQPDRYAG